MTTDTLSHEEIDELAETARLAQCVGERVPLHAHELARLISLARDGLNAQWRDIKDAPKDGTPLILVNSGNAKWSYIGTYREGSLGEPSTHSRYWRSGCCGRFGTPTHFMHPPTPPERGE